MVRALLRARPPRAPKPPAQTRGGSFEREPSHSFIFQHIWKKLFPAEVGRDKPRPKVCVFPTDHAHFCTHSIARKNGGTCFMLRIASEILKLVC